MALPGAAPCQCLTLAGQMTTSPALISWMGLPHSWVRPTPAVTMSTCPTGWICQWEREPGSKVTLPPLERMALLAAYRGSMRTVPVKKRGEPLMGVCCPQ